MISSHTPVLDYPAHTPLRIQAEFLIEDCLECTRASEKCAQDCLRGLSIRLMVEYRILMLETADAALTAARAVAQKTSNAADLCWVCAQLCKACIGEFEQYETNSFKQCVATCRRCADSCLDFAETH